MHPLALVAIAFGLGKIFENSFSSNDELNSISKNSIYDDYKRKHFKKTHNGALKGQITKSINEIIPLYKSFKIGKTGNPPNRHRQHVVYKEMFLLCESRDANFISDIETYFNEKYLNHEKNDNIKGGSACKSKSVDGKHYLYIVVR
jgi:hypothetical protein